jgi:dTDP-4-dehydrorhamnose 3,5-epimerase
MSWRLEGMLRDGQSVTPDWAAVRPPPIDGVAINEARPVVKGNGLVTEIFRTDWFEGVAHVDQVFQVLLLARGISAWHAHAQATDRLFVSEGFVRLMLFDSRPDAVSCGRLMELLLSGRRPQLVVVPPRVWHGVENLSDEPATILNLPDRAYQYAEPDHWRLPIDTDQIPYRFGSKSSRRTGSGESPATPGGERP